MNTIPAKTILTSKKYWNWFGIEYNMNIYRGCSHGCIYCDSRSECYGIDNFDQVCVKDNAIEILHQELRRKRRKGLVGTGAMSDPYNPYEKKLELTRKSLALLNRYQFGIAIATKSDLILRDIDLLEQIQRHSPVICKITITTTDDALSKKIEPFVCPSSNRFSAVKALSSHGIFTGLLLMPILPRLTDSPEHIVQLVEEAASCGAKFIYPAFGMTLRQNQREYYYNKLDRLFPEQRLTQWYKKQYGTAYECRSLYANELIAVFAQACKRNGILFKMPDIIQSSRKPFEEKQLMLF